MTPPENEQDIIRAGVAAALQKSLLPAILQKAYPGHFNIVADGSAFGGESTWPGLDSWQCAGAYLLLGKHQLVLDYFDFVQVMQRADGNIPFAVFPAEVGKTSKNTHLNGLRYPEDIVTYQPPKGGYPERQWIGLFHHWIAQANPLSTLGSVCFLLTAGEIFAATGDTEWVRRKIPALEAAARFLLSQRSENGLIPSSGFYLESPPRFKWDGVAQCYVVHGFRTLARLCGLAGLKAPKAEWEKNADTLAEAFRRIFWRTHHFAEYVHPQRGVIDMHGLTEVNFAAVAFDVATPEQADTVWPRLMAEREFWRGDMPTQTTAKPFTYQEWEFWESNEDVGFKHPNGPLYDIAAMGRVWYLETQACMRRGEKKRLRDAVANVCRMGLKHDGYWHERYHPLQVWGVYAAGPRGYCEYPAILLRTVLSNPDVFADIPIER